MSANTTDVMSAGAASRVEETPTEEVSDAAAAPRSSRGLLDALGRSVTKAREAPELLPRWLITSYAVLWALGVGFLWWPLAVWRLVRRRRPTKPGSFVVLAMTPVFLVASLSIAFFTAPLLRVVAAGFLVLPWLAVLLCTMTTWRPADVRAVARGLVDLAIVQGVLVGAALALPQRGDLRLPLGMLMPDSATRRPPLDAWLNERLAFPDYFAGPVTRTAGIFGNPTWAAGVAALAAMILICRPGWLGRGNRSRVLLWLAGMSGAAITLLHAYSRNSALGLVVGVTVVGGLAVLRRVSRRTRTWLVAAGLVLAGLLVAVVNGTQLFASFNSVRSDSLDARQAIYLQTLERIHDLAVPFLGNGIKDPGVGLVASLGSHSTLLGLVYRGGWLAFWGFVLFLVVLTVRGLRAGDGLAVGLVAFTLVWVSSEDLDTAHLVPLGLVLAVGLVRLAETSRTCPQEQLSSELVRRWRAGQLDVVTWVNHSSALALLTRRRGLLTPFTLIGLDGNGIRLLLNPAMRRTSADVVLPQVLPQLDGARVVLIGGTPEQADARRAAITEALAPGARVVGACDGYEGLLEGDALRRWITDLQPDVVIVALGAPLQEQYAARISQQLERGLVVTCGGFLDQLVRGQYYPSWAYPLHLNWLVRLAREPRRMWRRYSLQVLVALRRTRDIQGLLLWRPGYLDCMEIVAEPPRPTEPPEGRAVPSPADASRDPVHAGG